MRIKTLLMSLLMFSVVTLAQKKEYVITNYGAIADGVTNNAAAIQKAIDKASKDGGGKVIIPEGNFASGIIAIKSNVELHLKLGARLLGSVNRNDYNKSEILALVTAKGQKNISISGQGIIDGQAQELIKDIFLKLQDGSLFDPMWKYKRPAEGVRPKLIEFVDCSGISITGISTKNSTSWVQNYIRCNDLTIDNVKVESTSYWNNDGIDISDCKNVKITNCFVNAADDGICLKSESPNEMNENIYIADCTIRSSASAFKMGTSSHGGFKNVKVRNLNIYDTYRSAIALECVDGGILENIDIEKVTAKNTGNAIFIKLGNRKDVSPGIIKGVRIADVKAEVPLRKPDLGYPFEGPPDHLRYRYNKGTKERPDLGYPYTGEPNYPYNLIPSSITGLPGHNVQDITLENIEIIFGGSSDKNLAQIRLDQLNNIPEKGGDYPEFSMFGELPAWGIYVRHADGIIMKNVKLSFKEDDFRPALIFDDVVNVELENIEIPTVKELPIFVFNNSNYKSIKNVKVPAALEESIKEQNKRESK